MLSTSSSTPWWSPSAASIARWCARLNARRTVARSTANGTNTSNAPSASHELHDRERDRNRRKLCQGSQRPEDTITNTAFHLAKANRNPRANKAPPKDRATAKEAGGEPMALSVDHLLREARLNCRNESRPRPLDEGRRESDKSQSRRSHLELPR